MAEALAAARAERRPEIAIAQRIEPVEPVEADPLIRRLHRRGGLDAGDQRADWIAEAAVGVRRDRHVRLVGDLPDFHVRMGRDRLRHPRGEAREVAIAPCGRHVLEREIDAQACVMDRADLVFEQRRHAAVPLCVEVNVEGPAPGELDEASERERSDRRLRVGSVQTNVFSECEGVARIDAEAKRFVRNAGARKRRHRGREKGRPTKPTDGHDGILVGIRARGNRPRRIRTNPSCR